MKTKSQSAPTTNSATRYTIIMPLIVTCWSIVSFLVPGFVWAFEITPSTFRYCLCLILFLSLTFAVGVATVFSIGRIVNWIIELALSIFNSDA